MVKEDEDLIKKWLWEHIKDLDYHSARKTGKLFRWNTPIMNEFVAFGLYVFKHSSISMADGICIKCGYEKDMIWNYCPNCGKKAGGKE